MSGNSTAVRSRQRGQVIAEYVIMMVVLIIVTLAVLSFSFFFSLYGQRMVDSVSTEYP